MKLLPLLLLLALPAVVQAQFTFTTNNGAITITGYTGTNLSVTIPDTINGLPVTAIGNFALDECPRLTSVTIGTNVTSIGYEAFYLCAFTNLTIPEGVVSIGDRAFYYCTSLTNINIPDGVTSIGDQVFYSCSSLTGITIGTNVTSIGHEAFRDCTNLTRVALPSSVNNIGIAAFFDCTSLTNIAIPGSVTNIGNYAFSSCASLASVTIPTNLTDIKIDAFWGCAQLVNVTIPTNINQIEDGAFASCGLTNITLPYSITNIGNGALANCPSLSAITVDGGNSFYSSAAGVLFDKSQTTLIQFPGGKGGAYAMPDNVTNISGAVFFGCSKLTSVVIGTNITSIPDVLFEYCANLTSVTIPNRVTSIGIFAFLGCSSLTSLTIPSNVTNIGNQAFSYCTSLTGLYFTGNAPANVGMDIFGSTVYYLPGTTGWENFAQTTGISTALWLPQAQMTGTSFGAQTNQFGFNINWASGQTVVVEASTNLVDWQPVQTNTLTTGTAYFSDPQWTNYPGRFYRLRSP
jgi:hypothetical protein